MTKHTKKTVTVKKYDMKRSEIVASLDKLADRIDAIDTHNLSPHAVEEELNELRGDLVDLAAFVTDERH